jgi:hypothetical protein
MILTRFVKSMHIHGVLINSKRRKENNKKERTSIYIDGRQITLGIVTGFINSSHLETMYKSTIMCLRSLKKIGLWSVK